MIDQEKIRILESMTLLNGAHPSFDDGVCAMEAVAWLAGEPHSDHPKCACLVVASFVRRLNDLILDDATRTRLMRPILAEIIGSRTSHDVMSKRAYVAADFAVRIAAPMALEARERKVEAEKLRALAPIVDRETAQKASAAAYAASSASASSAAYAASYAASAAAASASSAAADAAYAAAADAAYAAAASARLNVYELSVDCIRRMLAIKEAA